MFTLIAQRYLLILCLLGDFLCFCRLFKFKNQLFEKILSGIPSVSNNLDSDQARCLVGPELGPNCLQKLSADDTRR